MYFMLLIKYYHLNKSLFLIIERIQLRWFCYLVRMPCGGHLREAFQGCPTRRRTQGDPGHARKTVSLLTFDVFAIPLEELEEVTREKDVWTSLFRLLTHIQMSRS